MMAQDTSRSNRKILHIDLDAFFCAVEEQYNPQLIGKPFAVGGKPEERGVVASCSYPARKYGIRSAMPMARAVKLCPDLIIVPSRHRNYSEVSRKVMAYLEDITPLVEKISIDEAFLDVTDIPESGKTIAVELQRTIHKHLALPCSIGVATNKLVAKIANDIGKASTQGSNPPNAITVVPEGQEAAFLAPLPVVSLWGVGPKTAIQLERLGISTIGDLSQVPEDNLVKRFGKVGHELFKRSHGIDTRPVITTHEVKSISRETTFAKDIRNAEELRHVLLSLTESVARRLRKAKLCGSTVRIKIRWTDFTTLTRQMTLEVATDQDIIIYENALELFEKAWPEGKAVRLIGVAVSGLGPKIQQLSFWDDGYKKEKRLQSAVDILRQRYGNEIIVRGAYLPKKDG